VIQAESLGKRLEAERIDCIYSSGLKRAADTARIIARPHRLEVVSCPELREIDFGKLEGLSFKDIVRRFPKIAAMWNERDDSLAYPGGESLVELEDRVTHFRVRLENHPTDDTVLVVAHAGVLRTLICQLLGLGMRNRWSIRLDLASLSVVETFPEMSILCLLNDTSHLKHVANRNSRAKGAE
jgi:alpha-ribazole phosphatase